MLSASRTKRQSLTPRQGRPIYDLTSYFLLNPGEVDPVTSATLEQDRRALLDFDEDVLYQIRARKRQANSLEEDFPSFPLTPGMRAYYQDKCETELLVIVSRG